MRDITNQNTKGMPLVSVLMTAYNREKFIAEAIKSVISSTYQHWELIISDDCSTDKTVEIAQTFASKDKRIKVSVNEHNLQQFKNRNKAALLASGKYIKYVDSDDIIYPKSLSLMVSIMEEYSDCGMGFSCSADKINFTSPHRYSSHEAYVEHYFKNGLLLMGPIATIFRSDAFKNVGMFDLYGMPSDNHLSLKIAAKYNIVSMPENLIFWRIHGNQAFSDKNDYENIFNNYNFNLNILSSNYNPLNDIEKSWAINNQRKILALNILKIVFQKPASIPDIKQILKAHNLKWSFIFRSFKLFLLPDKRLK